MSHICGRHIKSYNDTFIYPQSGAVTFINYLSEKISQECIKTNTISKTLILIQSLISWK